MSEKEKISYSEKLRDPRWQKKRLEVFQRDNWTCQKCFSKEDTLNVHHRKYIPKHDPWDYPLELLVTLCEECHEEENEYWNMASQNLLEHLQDKFLGTHIVNFAHGINNLKIVEYSAEFISEAYDFALSDEKMQKYIYKQYKKFQEQCERERIKLYGKR